jgi:hypothetical protein
MSSRRADLAYHDVKTEGPRRQVCRDCDRTVHMIRLDQALVAVDPEIISVVTGSSPSSRRQITARRLHAELCLTYQQDRSRQKIRKEKAIWQKLRSRPL